MSEFKELNVSTTCDTLTVLHGKALEQKAPNVISIAGDIDTVASFIKKRYKKENDIAAATEWTGEKISEYERLIKLHAYNYQLVLIDKAIITVDKFGQTITLQVDPQDPYGVTVTGKLEESEELKPFRINKDTTFTKEQLVKLLRFSRLLFHDAEKHATLLQAYQSFSAKAYIDLQQSADTRGNKANNFTKTVDTNIPADFILTVPIFKGQLKETFRVEICLDVTEGSARFWFESVELKELEQNRIEEIFEEQLKACGDFVIINK